MRFKSIIFSLNFLYIVMIAAQVAAIVFLCLSIPAVIPIAAAYAGAFVLSFITAVILLSRKSGSEIKCAWLTLIAAVPIAGAVVYLLAAAKDIGYGVLTCDKKSLSPLGACANAMCGTGDAAYDSAVYFKDGAVFFERLFSEIKRAKRRVYVEFFIIGRGKIFDMFVSALNEASRNGAEIKIIADGVGSAFKLKKKDIKRLNAAGAEVKIFHRITPVPRSRLGFRDHRKIAVIDGAAAFTGGMNLADEYANLTRPYGYWKDTGLAVYGNAAQYFEGMFLAMWKGSYSFTPSGGGKYPCLPFCDSPTKRGFGEEIFLQAISSAKQRVHIMTPYFCVSERLAGALEFAARRGVDVTVILPHIPDKPYAFELSKACAHTLEPSGVRFFEYTPGFLHAKAVICDGKVFLGSYNFDFRSLRLNYECGIMFEGRMCDEAEQDFLGCLALSQPLTEGKISPAKRFSRFILRLFAPLI